MAATEMIGRARANIYFVDCPVAECNGYLTTPETGEIQWKPDDFKRGAVGHCDECDQVFKVRR